ncbi:uncharacterized protein LOC142230081 [Haematobia irritans]|uniref:uncharacterized protein LOC142230081 n=1 Tax=Haematobia irritans TaxID=7368 RepID=UPI003F50A446
MVKSKFFRVRTCIVIMSIALCILVEFVEADSCLHRFRIIHEPVNSDFTNQVNEQNYRRNFAAPYPTAINQETTVPQNHQTIQIIRKHPNEYIKTIHIVPANSKASDDENYPSVADAIETLKSLKAFGAFSDERRLLNSYGKPIANSWQFVS